MVSTTYSPPSASLTIVMGVSLGENSAMTCRQEPQGREISVEDVTTAMATKSRCPAATAQKIALRSAHTVRPNDAFSTLQPL